MKATYKSLLAGVMIMAFGSANAQQELKFDKIRMAGAGSVEISMSEKHSMMLESNTSAIPSSLFNIQEDGWLVINGRSSDEIKISAPQIKQIDITGTGSIDSDDSLVVDDIKLVVSGVGKIDLDVHAKKIRTIISGSGKVELEGTADELIIDISGAGRVDAEELKVKTCTANISGSGKCLVDVTEVLNANISGSGSVYYVKTPALVNRNVSGSGKVGDANVSVQDTTRIMLGKTKVLIVDDNGKSPRQGFKEMIDAGPGKVKSHWSGFEMGVNLFMNEDFKFDSPNGYGYLDLKPQKSIALNFNLYDLEVKLLRRNIMLVTGLGLTINNYRFDSGIHLQPDVDTVIGFTDPVANIKKNKLVATYLSVPLLLEFNTSENPDKTFHIALGVIGGLKTGSHLKLVKEVGGDESKVKYRDDFNINPWRYDATVRLGYRNFTVFGSYNLAVMFKDKKGPELNTFTAGIRLVGW
jgi:hypothetical protein